MLYFHYGFIGLKVQIPTYFHRVIFASFFNVSFTSLSPHFHRAEALQPSSFHLVSYDAKLVRESDSSTVKATPDEFGMQQNTSKNCQTLL